MGVVIPAWETRVLKAHVQAVIDALPTALAAKRLGSQEDMAKVLAEAVLLASDDSKTRYVVIVVPDLFVFGPYASYDAAVKATQKGLPSGPDSKARIEPLIPASRPTRAAKEKTK